MSSCDFHFVLYLYSGIRCHFHTPVGLCCYESSSMRPYKVFLVASLHTLIAASCQLYLRADSIRRLAGRLAASLPTCHSHSCGTSLSLNNVGRTLSLHYYYLAFVVLTYLAYLIAVVNTSYRSSLVLQTWAYKPLVALD
jgi:hypothetical protein